MNCHGPVADMVGLSGADTGGWDVAERAQLESNIAERKPFLDFIYSRTADSGAVQYLQVSGEPVFDEASRFIGYRGVGRDITAMAQLFSAQRPATA